MIRIGITGQSGFIGSHLFNTLGLHKDFERIHFRDEMYHDDSQLRSFVRSCDVIVHLAAINRNTDQDVLYSTNLELVNKLIDAMSSEDVTPHLIFSSSVHEKRNDHFGRSKREGRKLFESWAAKTEASFTNLIIPNVFGPFSLPNYNTFVATFAKDIISGATPHIIEDANVNLIYIGTLCEYICNIVRNRQGNTIISLEIKHDLVSKVSDIMNLFRDYKLQYIDQGIIPMLHNKNEVNLFNTFRSYINNSSHFPVILKLHSDFRGNFVETLKLGIGGQVSFSTTVPGVTRGNHFHIRKIERFTVIRGKARIQLRKIGDTEVISLYLDGSAPAYVDIPVWYTHNLTNVGDDDLYTQFWTNEIYDPENSDTFYENV